MSKVKRNTVQFNYRLKPEVVEKFEELYVYLNETYSNAIGYDADPKDYTLSKSDVLKAIILRTHKETFGTTDDEKNV